MKSIKTKFITFISVLLAVTLLSLGVLNFFATSKLLQAETDKEVALRSEVIVQEIEKFLIGRVSIMETFAKQSAALYGDDKKELEFIKAAVASTPELKSMVYSPDVTGKKAVSHEGKSVDLSTRPYIKDLAEGKTAISNPLIDKLDGKLAIIIGAPVMIKGKPGAFLVSSVSIDDLMNVVAKEKIGDTGYAFMFDASGITVTHPFKDNIMSKNVKDYGIPAIEQAFENALKGGKGKIDYTFEGIHSIGYYTKTSNNWIVMLSVPSKELSEGVRELGKNTMILTAFFIILGILLAYFVAQRLVRPIQRLNQAIQIVSSGNLLHRIELKGKDEIVQAGTSFNQMVDAFRKALTEVNLSSAQLAIASDDLTTSAKQTSLATEHIASSMEQMMSGTEQQVTSVEHSRQAVAEMSGHVQVITDLAEGVASEVRKTYGVSADGEKVIHSAIEQMGSIATTVQTLSEEVHQLGAYSKEIGQIVQVITSIAQQTNLLALNAGIEAARAGESGKGFAVVANEVRSLAEQSGASAQRITHLVATIQAGAGAAETTMKLATNEVTAGIEVVDSAGALFESIKLGIGHVVDQIQQVTGATQEVVHGNEIMVGSITTISSAAEVNMASTQSISASAEEQLASMEEIAASAETLSNMADELKQLITKFKI
ncbi:methyl-accepting chemotaxis protein [Paenibacillus sp. SYP-B3998]|uniref:Methyl-accepting chemotaxis protein n=1 Tax=Paenibacillus sp. SYP-B3998 TaxID=2678564 RepID=A0A6G3ZYT3_9BACL|nr:methyl-accepting chemotaxis protein [Paenibacillus sp. SYP-B3998]NEW07373.1 methyl-accepting chemotaxis protein [Paenibacillus sp. SYP-B3998]